MVGVSTLVIRIKMHRIQPRFWESSYVSIRRAALPLMLFLPTILSSATPTMLLKFGHSDSETRGVSPSTGSRAIFLSETLGKTISRRLISNLRLPKAARITGGGFWRDHTGISHR